MSNKKKNGREKHQLEKILLATAILQLVEIVIEIIKNLIE